MSGSRANRQDVTVTVAQGEAAAITDERLLGRGALLGRYVILELLGSGGMSVVYSAYDPQLDRRVAIKVMRTSYWNDAGRQRALREAQALARLSHPNIVAVHDVGTLGDQLFFAMELVDGETLDRWLLTPGARRSWRDVVEVMIQAGRGLGAAHRAGLVHRDIKPTNIMVDQLGRARVMDFGVVAHAPDAGPDRTTDRVAPHADGEVGGGADLLPGAATAEDRVIVGTPSYMAPEQRDGIADTRSDQYAFCVTLVEALTGERPPPPPSERVPPTPRSSVPLLPWSSPLAALGADRAAAERARRVPGWLRQILARGLAADPARRYPSMDALVSALGRDLGATRRRAALAALFAATVIVALWWARSERAPQPVCHGARAMVEQVWGPTRRGQVHSNLLRGGRPYAEETSRRVAATLDRRAAEWADLRTEACLATHARGEQSQAVLDLRLQCLDRQLWELRALTTVLATHEGGEIVDNAVQSALALAPIARCTDVTGVAPLPGAARLRASIAETFEEISRGSALVRAGFAREASPLLLAAVARSRELDFAPLLAEALRRLGEAQSHLGDAAAAETTQGEALAVAAAARDDAVVVAVAPALVHTMGYLQARPAEALAFGKAARAMIARAGDTPSARSALWTAEGVALWSSGRYLEAKERFEQVIAVDSQPGGDELRLAAAHNTLGLVLKELGRHRDAGAMLDRAQEIWEQVLGPDHPDVGRALNNHGELAIARRDLDRAEAAYQRALSIFERAFGPSHRFVEVAIHNLGELDVERGRFAEALARCERAAELARHTVDAGHPLVAYHAACRAKALLGLGRAGEALVAARLAEQVAGRATMDPAEVAQVRFVLARALWDSGQARPRALTLAAGAAAALAKAGARKDAARAEVERWLEDRGAPVRPLGATEP